MKKIAIAVSAITLFLAVNVAFANTDTYGQPFQDLWNSVTGLQQQIDDIQLIPGEQGPQGPTGPMGPQGEPGLACDESRLTELEARLAYLESLHENESPLPGDVVFEDDFNDGDTIGWWLGYASHYPWVEGNWRVEDIGLPHYGVLIQDAPGDHFRAIVEDIELSNQTIETRVKLNDHGSYGGVTVWYQDDRNWVSILIYPAAGFINVLEGTSTTTTNNYYYHATVQNTWYDLKVVADSTTGELEVYLDGIYLFTHNTSTNNRTGFSGVNNGNAGAYFDNFRLTID